MECESSLPPGHKHAMLPYLGTGLPVTLIIRSSPCHEIRMGDYFKQLSYDDIFNETLL